MVPLPSSKPARMLSRRVTVSSNFLANSGSLESLPSAPWPALISASNWFAFATVRVQVLVEGVIFQQFSRGSITLFEAGCYLVEPVDQRIGVGVERIVSDQFAE